CRINARRVSVRFENDRLKEAVYLQGALHECVDLVVRTPNRDKTGHSAIKPCTVGLAESLGVFLFPEHPEQRFVRPLIERATGKPGVLDKERPEARGLELLKAGARERTWFDADNPLDEELVRVLRRELDDLRKLAAWPADIIIEE